MRIEISNKLTDNNYKSYQQIIKEYIYYFGTGYNLTLNEISDYLDCSIRYAQLNIKEKITYINVNDFVRIALRSVDEFTKEPIYFIVLSDYSQEEIELYWSLFKKRLLLSRNEFNDYIIENTTIERRTKTFDFMELEKINEIEEINKNIDIYKKIFKKESLDTVDVLNYVINNIVDVNPSSFEVKQLKRGKVYISISVPKIEEYSIDYEYKLPGKLYGLAEIKKQIGYRHDIEAHRDIENLGIKKYKINTLVRYDLEEWKMKKYRNNLKMSYSKYKELKQTMNDREIFLLLMKEALQLINTQ